MLARRGTVASGQQPVTNPTGRFDGVCPEGAIDLAAQITHVNFHDVVRTIELPIPNTLQDIAFRHHGVLVADEILEHAELSGGKRDGRFAARDQSSGWIEGEGAGSQYDGALRSPAPNQRVQPRDEHP